MHNTLLTPEIISRFALAMVEDGVPLLICKCKVENDRIVFCPLHEVAADLFEAVEYACRFLGSYHLAVPEQEATKVQTVLPYLSKVLAKARRKPQ
jgi:hypothetical protein